MSGQVNPRDGAETSLDDNFELDNKGTRSNREDRLIKIRELVKSKPHTIDDLVHELGVSLMTVYRDVATLHQQGMVHRQRGVVTVAPSRTYESPSSYRIGQHSESKAALAAAAATLIEPGESVMLDDSTAGIHLARRLVALEPLTVITNSLAVARELDNAADITVFLTGGQLAPWAEALYGPMTVQTLRALRADVVLMSASAVSNNICYHPDSQMAQVKQAFLAAAERKVLYIDKTKFDRTALHVVANIADFDIVIVEHGTDAMQLQQLVSMGIEVIVAPELAD